MVGGEATAGTPSGACCFAMRHARPVAGGPAGRGATNTVNAVGASTELRRRRFGSSASQPPDICALSVGESPATTVSSRKEDGMPDGVYRVTEVIGVSSESWEAAARNAVQTAAQSVRDLRIAEVIRQDVTIENGDVSAYRVRLGISFKYESGDS